MNKSSWLRHIASLLRGILVVALLGAAASLLPASAAQADPGDIGYQDISYTGAREAPSGDKPESKLWFNDGRWWGSLFDAPSQHFHLFWLDPVSQVWQDTGVTTDTRSDSHADVLWDGSKLYVASHKATTSAASGYPSLLYRFSYNPASKTYSPDPGFPAQINNVKTETLVIDKDTTGSLWATWTAGNRVWVNRTTPGNYAAWGTPFLLPSTSTSLNADDISSLVAVGGTIGVMWSDQNAQITWYSAHTDGAASDVWSTREPALTGAKASDDHINLKSDAGGRVYAAVKTSKTSGPEPLVLLLTREPGGTWQQATIGTVAESFTRPTVQIDDKNSLLRVFYTGPRTLGKSGQEGGDIYEKTAPLGATPTFASGLGTPVIRDLDSPFLNNNTSSKQHLDAVTGVTVLASNDTTKYYWHHYLSLGAPVAPVAAFSGSPTTGSAPLLVQFTDTSTGSPSSWSWDFGDGSTSTAQNPAHSYTAAGTYTVSLTATNATGSNTTTKVGYVQVGTGTGGTTTVAASADAQVKSTSPTANYGTATTLQIRAGTSSTDTTYRTYLSFPVNGLGGAVTGATLQFNVTDATKNTITAASTGNGWTETGLTYNNAPAVGTGLGSAAGLALGIQSITLDPSGFTGNGTYSIVLTSSSTDSAILTSRQGSSAPQLVLTTSSGAPVAPVAAFSGSPTTGSAPLLVQFTDTSTGSPSSWAWDFGDGSTSTAQNPAHSYTAAGTYTVSLTATNATGSNTTTKVGYVQVGTGTGGTTTVAASADAQVKSTSPTANYGTATTLQIRAGTSSTDTTYRTYLSFPVNGLGGAVTGATLQFNVTDATKNTITAASTGNGWTETGLTYNNAPAVGTGLGSAAGLALGIQSITLDPSGFTGNGTYSIVLTSSSTDSAILTSRQGSSAPQLVLTTSG